mgnify:CR=1 FL=1|jgi:hypothetical protein
MNATDFLSSNSYIYLPTSKNPKVALVVDNSALAQNAFKLYNPFSQKAKLFKKGNQLAFISFNAISKIVWRTKQEEKSAFVSYLETKLDKMLVASLYFASINDKVVMQLQTPDAQIVGYLKYPLNEVGLQHLENEKKAIEILSEKNIVQQYLLHDEFNGISFLLLSALEGKIGLVERSQVDELILKFKREELYKFSDHPRIMELKKSVNNNDMSKYLSLIAEICKNSTMQYALVYEHGDFTPWNIVNVDGNYIPFDFEYFVEDGLEYFDLIKYYYQIGKLLEGMKAKELIAYISEQINTKEIRELLQLFLIKEIVRNKEQTEPYDFEVKLLEVMETR